MVGGRAGVVRKYELARLLLLSPTLSARRFAPRPISPHGSVLRNKHLLGLVGRGGRTPVLKQPGHGELDVHEQVVLVVGVLGEGVLLASVAVVVFVESKNLKPPSLQLLLVEVIDRRYGRRELGTGSVTATGKDGDLDALVLGRGGCEERSV